MNYPRIAPKARDPNDRSGEGNLDNTPGPTPLKRIPYACTSCKKAKTKCSGLPPPCQRCVKFGGECVFDEATDQRRRVAAKRTADDLKRQQELWNQLLITIGGSDQEELLQLQGLVRRGASTDEIEEFIQNKLKTLEEHGKSGESSSTSLKEVQAQLTEATEATSSESPPPKRQMVSSGIDSRSNLFDRPLDIATSRRRRSDIMAVSNLCDVPPFRVPVDAWTDLVDQDDDLVSQLVSIFLTWLNPILRIVDQEAFLEDMRTSNFAPLSHCTPFLVNAILAISSHFSNHISIFLDKKDPMTRGMKFHQEAHVLNAKEDGRVSLVNIQAISLLALDSIIRGQDEIGWTLFAQVRKMYNDLGLHKDPSSRLEGLDERQQEVYLRTWRFVSWSIFNMTTLFSLVICQPPEVEIPETQRPLTPESMDLTSTWIEYPGLQAGRDLKADHAFDSMCDLMKICWKISKELFSKELRLKQANLEEVLKGSAFAGLENWEKNLSTTLLYHEGAAPLIFELQICKCCVKTRCFYLLYKQYQSAPLTSSFTPNLSSNDNTYDYLLTEALRSAHEGAMLTRRYREEFTFERVTLHMAVAACLGCSVLIDRIDEPQFASDFVDLFQCLFAGGHKFFLARTLAQMTLLAARHAFKRVPQQVLEMIKTGANTDPLDQASLHKTELKAMAESWQPKDKTNLASFFPDEVAHKSSERSEIPDVGLEELITKWDGMGLGGNNAAGVADA